MVTNDGIVFNNGAGVEDAVFTDGDPCIDKCLPEYDTAFANG